MSEAGEFRLPLRVYIEDTDAGGIVYYVNYLKYMERARTEFMRDRGFAKAGIFNDRLMFVVRSLDLDYRAPARLDDELQACASLEELRGASMVFVQRILRGEEELATARVRIACVEQQTLKPAAIPADMRSSLAARE